jgi:hypothetical protein
MTTFEFDEEKLGKLDRSWDLRLRLYEQSGPFSHLSSRRREDFV